MCDSATGQNRSACYAKVKMMIVATCCGAHDDDSDDNDEDENGADECR